MSSRGIHRVCILTQAHLSLNPRLVKEADALSEAGYDVSVIAADYSLWARDADRVFSERAWQVVRTLTFGPHAPRLPRVIELMRRHSARAILAAGFHHHVVTRAAWHPIAPDLVRAALDVSADLYIAHYPAALPAAAIAAKRHHAQYAYDAEDFHLGDAPERPEYDVERRMVRTIEGRYLPGCAYVTAASPGIADAYVDAYRIARPTVVLNVFPRTESTLGSTPKGTAAPGPSLYWFSQTIGPDRGLECALEAISRSRSRPHLYLRGTPAKGFLDRMWSIARSTGVEQHLHILPPASPGELVKLAAPYDVGLVGEPGHTKNNRIALANKLFTYLSAGLPCILSDVPAHANLVHCMREAGYLYERNDADGLAGAIDALLDFPEVLAEARREAWYLGQGRFNWETEKRHLQEIVCDVLKGRKRSVKVFGIKCAWLA